MAEKGADNRKEKTSHRIRYGSLIVMLAVLILGIVYLHGMVQRSEKKAPASQSEPPGAGQETTILESIEDLKAGQILDAASLDLNDPDKYFTSSQLTEEQKEDMKLDLPGVKVVATGKKIVYRAIEEETSTPKVEEYNTLVVPRGGEYMLELSDGTKVWLNSDSELRFPVTFVGDRRNVEIEGEAYFEVAKDEAKPFHVLANGADIKVLGTSFNVRLRLLSRVKSA